MMIVNALGQDLSCNVLDLCAAPGGKSVYFVHNSPNSNIVACDIHAHKLPLISNYAKSMGVSQQVQVLLNDATVYNPDFESRFDIVLCDVPCSGLGMVYSKHEIVLTTTMQDIQQLTIIQSKILSNAARYVRSGGRILYSTCTITIAENESVVRQFLKTHSDFETVVVDNQYVHSDDEGYIRLWPHLHGTDGFFAAVLTKKYEQKTIARL
jgi:16S rRNA (cytosine967-C5)-methyltransferase